MANIPVKDDRGFFILPQRFEGGGYYTYGSPQEDADSTPIRR